MKYLQVTTTAESREDADRLARALLDARVAACVQIVGPITSSYWWKGGVETDEEWLCLIKTTMARFDELAERIKELHSYETPEITAVPISQGSPDYLAWIGRETGG
ncbi:MAG TPA: divalent-cation tolerance protein CutA [Frankiaceae bacterium]|nr:divalent-cation tolerance protein CutA [Frankiaceae bacterium]